MSNKTMSAKDLRKGHLIEGEEGDIFRITDVGDPDDEGLIPITYEDCLTEHVAPDSKVLIAGFISPDLS